MYVIWNSKSCRANKPDKLFEQILNQKQDNENSYQKNEKHLAWIK